MKLIVIEIKNLQMNILTNIKQPFCILLKQQL